MRRRYKHLLPEHWESGTWTWTDAPLTVKQILNMTRNPLLETVGKSELREAVMFVHALCKILKRNPPASREWADTLTVKALAVLNATSASDLDATFKWLLANRASQEIPPRLDFLLDRFPEFLSKALKDFR